MTLSERTRTCTTEGCRRAPAYPDQAKCSDHRERWLPEWRRRALEDLVMRGHVAAKEVA